MNRAVYQREAMQSYRSRERWFRVFIAGCIAIVVLAWLAGVPA